MMPGLKPLTLVLFISVITASCLQCMQYRVNLVNRQKSVQQSYEGMSESEKNNYHAIVRQFLNHIKYYLGTPYQYGGNSRQGMDCSGFVSQIFRESFNIELPHNALQIYQQCQKISPQEMNLGDLVFFRVSQKRKIDHVGIYLVKSYFVHASVSDGVVVSELTDKYYRSRFAGAGRIIDLRAISYNNSKTKLKEKDF